MDENRSVRVLVQLTASEARRLDRARKEHGGLSRSQMLRGVWLDYVAREKRPA